MEAHRQLFPHSHDGHLELLAWHLERHEKKNGKDKCVVDGKVVDTQVSADGEVGDVDGEVGDAVESAES